MNSSDLAAAGYQAIKQGDKPHAASLFKAALEQDKNDVSAWLGLARIAATPSESLAYVRRAEAIAPNDPTVQRAKRWAENRMATSNTQSGNGRSSFSPRILAFALVGVFGVALLLIAAFAWRSSGLENQTNDEAIEGVQLSVSQDVFTGDLVRGEVENTASQPVPVVTGTREIPGKSVASQDVRPTWTVTPTPLPTATPTPTFAPTFVSEIYDKGERPVGVGLDEKWIDVNISTQTLTAYEGDTAVFQRAISSGTWEYPTVTGQFRIWLTYESQTMDGTLLGFDYYLEDVPYVMYFYGDYAIHGTFWHNNFGTPTSHGCVNMAREDAGWIYSWAGLGTMVNVHH